MTKRRRVALIIGTRPEVIKLLPVYLALKNSVRLEPFMIVTGQHGSMVNELLDLFDVEPDLRLSVESGSLSVLTSSLFSEISNALDRIKPDGLIVQGDTTSAMVGAMVSFYHQVKVFHVEAGLRTFNKNEPFPEEVNRQIISRIADINFAPTPGAEENLRNESKLPGLVINVGNTVVDALMLVSQRIDSNPGHYKDLSDELENFDGLVLVTGHRRENLGGRMERILKSLSALIDEYPKILFIFPVHRNPKVREQVNSFLRPRTNLKITEPLSYDKMLFLMRQSELIITDSGGIQEEAPAFHVPVMVTREQTERPEGVERGFSFLVGSDAAAIRTSFQNIINGRGSLKKALLKEPNPYGDGNAAGRIVAEIAKTFES